MKYLMALFLALMATACSSDPAGISIENSNQNVVIGNAVLARSLVFNNAHTSKVNGLMKASVVVANKVNTDLNLQYRFYWYDAQGLEVSGSDAPWHQFVLKGNDTMMLQGVAEKSEASQYRIYVRKAEH
ncbi:YcfL family protein [Photobacterium leiognathi]|uniref:YcfL family protein n=1 Tax=Photobacterium leiognathi TaxID=553611 RepID=UPI00298161E1|nr:YcfL family protein [Photobacterium leiognathi]